MAVNDSLSVAEGLVDSGIKVMSNVEQIIESKLLDLDCSDDSNSPINKHSQRTPFTKSHTECSLPKTEVANEPQTRMLSANEKQDVKHVLISFDCNGNSLKDVIQDIGKPSNEPEGEQDMGNPEQYKELLSKINQSQQLQQQFYDSLHPGSATDSKQEDERKKEDAQETVFEINADEDFTNKQTPELGQKDTQPEYIQEHFKNIAKIVSDPASQEQFGQSGALKCTKVLF